MHYSGDKLYSFSIFGNANSCCEVPCDCCSDESDHYKLDVEYLISDIDTIKIKIIELVIDNYTSKITIQSLKESNQYSQNYYIKIHPNEEENTLLLLQSFLC
jgi:hypothetical protein